MILGWGGSVLAYWGDDRWLDSFDLYGQLLMPSGAVAPGWPDTGLMIARAHGDQRSGPGLAQPDGSFIIGIMDFRNADLPVGFSSIDSYLSRVLPDGSVDPAWPRHGFRAVDFAGQNAPDRMIWVAPDTLVMCCLVYGPDSFYQFLLQQVAITPTGPQLPWGPSGVLYGWRPHGALTTLSLVPDGAGGLFVLFDEQTSDANVDAQADLYLMRLGRDGLPAAGWEGGARPVSVAPGYQEWGVLRSDGAGGLYAVWADARDGSGLGGTDYLGYEDIRLLRMTAEGAPYPGWPAEGLLVSDAPGWQDLPALEPDGSGGVYVAWQDVNFLGVTRVKGDATFAPGWAKNGISVSTLVAYSTDARLVPGTGGVFALFDNISNGSPYLQHVLSSGVVDPSWPSTGIQVGHTTDADFISDGAGGCYVAYQTQLVPFGPSVIAVNRFGVDGVVPVKLAEGTAEAEPGRVHLVWRGMDAAAGETRVQRRPAAGGGWRDLGAAATRGRDELEFDDLTVEAGTDYAYRLVRGAEVLSDEVKVRVPAAAVFALAGATQNPALARELSVAFSLAGSGAARLEVLDLAGRREYSRELTGLSPGRHSLPLADASLAPGVHWLQLSEGARSAHARVVVVR